MAGAKRGGGRPGSGSKTKLTTQAKADILKAVKMGMTAKEAARAVGVTAQTYCNWMRRGREYEDLVSNPEDAIFFEFYNEVIEAIGQSERALVAAVRKSPDWRAQMTLLERRFPERWSRHKTRLAAADAAETDPQTTEGAAPVGMSDDFIEELKGRVLGFDDDDDQSLLLDLPFDELVDTEFDEGDFDDELPAGVDED